MRRAREDFASFVRARWVELTDELVDDELTEAQAQQAVVRGLADCQAGWRRVLAEDNPEVVVRDAIAYHRSSTLPDEPVTDPLAAIAAVRSERRRRIVKLTLVAGVAAAITAALVMFWPQDDTVHPPRRAEANPLPIAWWYGGELHLARAVVQVQGVEHIVRVGGVTLVATPKQGLLAFDDDGRVADFDGLGPVFSDRSPIPHPELVPADSVARSGTTTPAGNFVYAVQHRANEHAADDSIRLSTSGPWLILQCSLQAHPGFSPCQTVTQLPADRAQPPIFEQH